MTPHEPPRTNLVPGQRSHSPSVWAWA
jgi:hypothetical protein